MTDNHQRIATDVLVLLTAALRLTKIAKDLIYSELALSSLPYHLRSGYLSINRESFSIEELENLSTYLKEVLGDSGEGKMEPTKMIDLVKTTILENSVKSSV